MRKFRKLAVCFVIVIVVGLVLVACGDTNTATPVPTTRVVPSNTAGANASPARVISEKDGDTTLRLKVGESVLAGFDPALSWNIQVDPSSGSTSILSRSTQAVPEPYQVKFEAQQPGTVNLKAEGSCRPEPGTLCHQAIFVYTVTVTVS